MAGVAMCTLLCVKFDCWGCIFGPDFSSTGACDLVSSLHNWMLWHWRLHAWAIHFMSGGFGLILVGGRWVFVCFHPVGVSITWH